MVLGNRKEGRMETGHMLILNSSPSSESQSPHQPRMTFSLWTQLTALSHAFLEGWILLLFALTSSNWQIIGFLNLLLIQGLCVC